MLFLDFERGAHVELAAEALVVPPPPHIFQGRKFDLFNGSRRPLPADELGFVEPIDSLGEGQSSPSPTVPVEGVAPSSTIRSV